MGRETAAIRAMKRHAKATIRKLIMCSDDPGLDALHLCYAIQDAERERMKKDGKKPIDPECEILGSKEPWR